MIQSAGIISAGQGQRLRDGGISLHKPMVRVAGWPLIGHLLRNLELCGVRRAVIIFNEQEQDCADWARSSFPNLDLDIILKTTPSSAESFERVGERLGPGQHLISTVDALCSPEELRKMLDPEVANKNAVVLGLTRPVPDEKPLWAQWDPLSRRILSLGGPTGNYVTSGYYSVPGALFAQKPEQTFSALRHYLAWLSQQSGEVYGVLMENVLDIDRPEDLKEAELFYAAEEKLCKY